MDEKGTPISLETRVACLEGKMQVVIKMLAAIMAMNAGILIAVIVG